MQKAMRLLAPALFFPCKLDNLLSKGIRAGLRGLILFLEIKLLLMRQLLL